MALKKEHSSVHVPKGWHQESHQLWCDNFFEKAINSTIQALNTSKDPKPRALFLQLGYYMAGINDHQSACKLFAQAHEMYPDDQEVLLNKMVALSKCHQHAEAIDCGKQLLAKQPEDFNIWDGLAHNYYYLGMFNESAKAGRTSLEIKDKKFGVPTPDWSLPKESIQEWIKNKKRVISFSLWGNEEQYINGAIRNLLLVNDIYPGWEIWIYTDKSVPQKRINQFKELGAVILHEPEGQNIKQKLCWRFKVANHLDVGYFLVRDIDSVLNIREMCIVQQWLDSKKWFHTIHDGYTHTDVMLAGMWGGVANILPDLWKMLENYKAKTVITPHIDQWFLRDCVWRYVRQSCLVHDSCFNQIGALSIPSSELMPPQTIGVCEFFEKPEWQRQMIKPWLN